MISWGRVTVLNVKATVVMGVFTLLGPVWNRLILVAPWVVNSSMRSLSVLMIGTLYSTLFRL